MIQIIEHPRNHSGYELLIRDDAIPERQPWGNKPTRGKFSNYFHTRGDEQGRLVEVRLYGQGDGFKLNDGNGMYREINLHTVETSYDGKDWSADEAGVWLPDRRLWVGIKRRLTYPYGRVNMQLTGPFEVDTALAAAIYEAMNGRVFEEDVRKMTPELKK